MMRTKHVFTMSKAETLPGESGKLLWSTTTGMASCGSAASALKPQIGHNIGFQVPISTRSAWAPSRARHTNAGSGGAEKCAKHGPK